MNNQILSPRNDNSNRSSNAVSQISQLTLLNNGLRSDSLGNQSPQQRKENIKNLLINKFIKKYEGKIPINQLQKEITKFLFMENVKITEIDLKNLDNKLKEISSNLEKEKSKIFI